MSTNKLKFRPIWKRVVDEGPPIPSVKDFQFWSVIDYQQLLKPLWLKMMWPIKGWSYVPNGAGVNLEDDNDQWWQFWLWWCLRGFPHQVSEPCGPPYLLWSCYIIDSKCICLSNGSRLLRQERFLPIAKLFPQVGHAPPPARLKQEAGGGEEALEKLRLPWLGWDWALLPGRPPKSDEDLISESRWLRLSCSVRLGCSIREACHPQQMPHLNDHTVQKRGHIFNIISF